MPAGCILVFPDLRSRNAYIRVLQEITGEAPFAVGNSSSAQRAYYTESTMKMIIATGSEDRLRRLGRHRATTPVEVDDPVAAAHEAKRILNRLGFEATVDDEAEPEFDKGLIAFVVVPAFDGIVLMFWPKNPDPEAMKRFRASGEFRPWTPADLDAE